MYELIIKPRAILMQKNAYDWYEAQRQGLGEVFLKELDDFYLKLQFYPTAFAKKERNYRQVSLKKFPFIVVFKIYRNAVVVYAVFHTSRDPAKKLKGN